MVTGDRMIGRARSAGRVSTPSSIDVDGILAALPREFDDPGVNPWGSANLDEEGFASARESDRQILDEMVAEAAEHGLYEATADPVETR